MSKLYLFARSCFPNPKGWSHRTLLIRGKDKSDAMAAAHHKLKSEGSNDYLGEPKEVNYVKSN